MRLLVLVLVLFPVLAHAGPAPTDPHPAWALFAFVLIAVSGLWREKR